MVVRRIGHRGPFFWHKFKNKIGTSKSALINERMPPTLSNARTSANVTAYLCNACLVRLSRPSMLKKVKDAARLNKHPQTTIYGRSLNNLCLAPCRPCGGSQLWRVGGWEVMSGQQPCVVRPWLGWGVGREERSIFATFI